MPDIPPSVLGSWYWMEGHIPIRCHCLPIIDIPNRTLHHFSPSMCGAGSYGPHMRVKMEDLR